MAAFKETLAYNPHKYGLLSKPLYHKYWYAKKTKKKKSKQEDVNLKNFAIGYPKKKSATMDGYFDDDFCRVFVGEAYNEPAQRRRRSDSEVKRRAIGKHNYWAIAGPAKKLSCPGAYIGTLRGNVPYLSPLTQTLGPKPIRKRNFVFVHTKKGTGYGYIKLTMGQEELYFTEPLTKPEQEEEPDKRKKKKKGTYVTSTPTNQPFDPNPWKDTRRTLPPLKKPVKTKFYGPPLRTTFFPKKAGGCEAGCFDPHPPAMSPRLVYLPRRRAPTEPFLPTHGFYTLPICDLVPRNVAKYLTELNCDRCEGVMYIEPPCAAELVRICGFYEQ